MIEESLVLGLISVDCDLLILVLVVNGQWSLSCMFVLLIDLSFCFYYNTVNCSGHIENKIVIYFTCNLPKTSC